jgi:hypothetical protein
MMRKVAFATTASLEAKPVVKLPLAKLDVKPKLLAVAPAPAAKAGTKALTVAPAVSGKAGTKPAALAAKPAKKTILQTGTLASLAKAAKAEGGR